MKLLLLIPLLAILASCEEKSGLINVYDEISNFPTPEDRPITGAKVILLNDVEQYSTVKVVSLQDGEMTELADHSLRESKSGSHAYSLRLYPNQEGVPTWIYRFRGNTSASSSIGIHSETIEDSWKIAGTSGSQYGRLEDETEVLDSFVLYQNYKDFPQNPTIGGFDCFASLEEQQAFSKKYPKIKIILLTLE